MWRWACVVAEMTTVGERFPLPSAQKSALPPQHLPPGFWCRSGTRLASGRWAEGCGGMLFGERRIIPRREPAQDGRAAGEAVPPAAAALQWAHALLQPVRPRDILYCLFSASLSSLRGKPRLRREKTQKT